MSGAAIAEAAPAPRLVASPTTVSPGARVTVAAYDLTPSTDWQLQVCGNDGYGTSADCYQASTAGAATSEAGHFVVVLIAGIPPVPCPCVVQAVPLVGTGGVTEQIVSTPIAIIGAPTAPPVNPPAPAPYSGLNVERATLTGSGSWVEWFGGTPHRMLVVRLHNAGANLIPSTPFVLRAGRGPDPAQVVASPVVPALYPGQTVSYRVPVTFPALAAGRYEVRGVLGSSGQEVAFVVPITLFPWGSALVVLLLLVVVILVIVRRVRARRRRRLEQVVAQQIPSEVPDAVVVTSSGVLEPAVPLPEPAVVPGEPPPTLVDSPGPRP